MTLEQFYRRLAKTSRKFAWHLRPCCRNNRKRPEHHTIRTPAARGKPELSLLCPLEAVYFAKTGTRLGIYEHVIKGGRDTGLREQLGLSHFDYEELVSAADEGVSHNPAIRARLLKACGLAAKQ